MQDLIKYRTYLLCLEDIAYLWSRTGGDTWEEVGGDFKTLVLFYILTSMVVSWEHQLKMPIPQGD